MEFDVDQQILRNARRKVQHFGDDEMSAFETWALRRCPLDYMIAAKDITKDEFARKLRQSMGWTLVLQNS
jgi:hypothetical protein